MTSNETCSYEFDPDQWVETRDRDLRLIDDLPTGWSCDRPAGDDGHCLLHRNPDEKSGSAAVDRLLSEIETTDDAPDAVVDNRFIGARFGTLDLANRTLRPANNAPIDLRFARIDDALDCTRAIVQNAVRLSGAWIDGDATFRYARFDTGVDVSDAVVTGEFDGSDAEFAHHVWGINTAFDDEATFDRATVGGDLCLAGAEITANLRLASTDVLGNACFSRIDCDGALVVEPKRIGGNVWCVRSVFRTLDDDGEPNNLVRSGDIGGDVVVSESAFGDKISFEGIEVDGRFEFTDTSVATNWVDLTGCDIEAGTIGQPTDGTESIDHVGNAYVMYDFTDATVGDVRIRDGPGNGFERVYFKNTAFDDFDFGRHRSALLRTDWTIHTVEEGPTLAVDSDRGPLADTYDTLPSVVRTARWVLKSAANRTASDVKRKSIHETTYLKAKNGANGIGDSTAAAEFFQKEMTFRRKRHAEVALNGWDGTTATAAGVLDRLSATGAWIANVGLAATTGYGEKPHRVLVASFATIVLFALLFAASPESAFGGAQSFPDLLLLSFQSFITFVLGTPVTADASYTVRFLSAVEGLIGAFLVALSVFALTRSVHR